MIGSLVRAASQLPQPELLRPLLLSLVGAVIMILICGLFSWILLDRFSYFGIGMIDRFIALSGAMIFVAGAFLFYPSTVMMVAGFFLDGVADAVESRHYPGLPPPRAQGIREIFGSALTLLAMTVVLNIVLLPVYVLSFLVPGLSLVLFYLVNGYLFGREFFTIVAGRRLNPVDGEVMRRACRVPIFGAGVIIVVLTTIPVVNLAAPVLATAFMVHVFHRLRRRMPA